jgi:recombination protein RecA
MPISKPPMTKPRNLVEKMAKRARAVIEKPKTSYFTSEKENIQFVSTGCAVLDCALGGGLALGRTVNVVGDKSTAKTGTATEVMINFERMFPDGHIAYRETEEAWDDNYAEAMGLPIAKIDFGDKENPLVTVEDFFNDFDHFCDLQIQNKRPGLYVLDSLDALSDDAEMDREIDKASYGGAKAKKLSEMFRKITRKQGKANVLLLIVSQVRDNIGAMFGEKHKRSGGKALDFFASQVFWLAHLKLLKRTVNKVERPYGIVLKAKVKKNKVGMPFREADFTFEFAFGINDLLASVNWLDEVGRLDAIDIKKSELKEYLKSISEMPTAEYAEERARATKAVKEVWAEIEETFIPKRKKYG